MTRKWETCHEVQTAVNMIPINIIIANLRVRCPGQNPLLLRPVLKANKNTFTIYYLLRLHNPGCSVIFV